LSHLLAQTELSSVSAVAADIAARGRSKRDSLSFSLLISHQIPMLIIFHMGQFPIYRVYQALKPRTPKRRCRVQTESKRGRIEGRASRISDAVSTWDWNATDLKTAERIAYDGRDLRTVRLAYDAASDASAPLAAGENGRMLPNPSPYPRHLGYRIEMGTRAMRSSFRGWREARSASTRRTRSGSSPRTSNRSAAPATSRRRARATRPKCRQN
jgi:hypothetical protein